MSFTSNRFLDLPFLSFNLPWWYRHGFAIFMGSCVLWVAYCGELFRGRNYDPPPNEPFVRGSVKVLGVALICLSLWGPWLGK